MNWFKKWFANARSRTCRTSYRLHALPPTVEFLEDRCVPAHFVLPGAQAVIGSVALTASNGSARLADAHTMSDPQGPLIMPGRSFAYVTAHIGTPSTGRVGLGQGDALATLETIGLTDATGAVNGFQATATAAVPSAQAYGGFAAQPTISGSASLSTTLTLKLVADPGDGPGTTVLFHMDGEVDSVGGVYQDVTSTYNFSYSGSLVGPGFSYSFAKTVTQPAPDIETGGMAPGQYFPCHLGDTIQLALQLSQSGGATGKLIPVPPVPNGPPVQGVYADAVMQRFLQMDINASWLTVPGSSGKGAGILLLDKTGKDSLAVTGRGGVAVTGGAAIVVNSSNSEAAILTGNGNVRAAEIVVRSTRTTGHGAFLGTVNRNEAPVPDPLAPVSAPPLPAVIQSHSTLNITGGVVTLQPGRYLGGIKISGQARVTLAPGLYYLDGGGFSVSGRATVTDNGQGVMLYNAPAGPSDGIAFTGQGDMHLSGLSTAQLPSWGLTDARYAGVAIFQDRKSTAVISLTGQGNVDIAGTVYAATATIKVTGNGSLNLKGSASRKLGAYLIAGDLTVTGNGGVNVDSSNNDLQLR